MVWPSVTAIFHSEGSSLCLVALFPPAFLCSQPLHKLSAVECFLYIPRRMKDFSVLIDALLWINGDFFGSCECAENLQFVVIQLDLVSTKGLSVSRKLVLDILPPSNVLAMRIRKNFIGGFDFAHMLLQGSKPLADLTGRDSPKAGSFVAGMVPIEDVVI